MFKVILNYLPDSHEFTLQVHEAKTVSYTLLYAFDREFTNAEGALTSEQVTEALTGQGTANASGVYVAKTLAGSESNDQRVLHKPLKGAIEVKNTDATNHTTTYQANFVISSTGKVDIITETQLQDAGQVAGVSSTSAVQKSDNDATGTARLDRPDLVKTTSAPIASTTSSPFMQSPLLLGASGLVLAALIVGLIWWWLRRRTTTTLHSLDSLNTQ